MKIILLFFIALMSKIDTAFCDELNYYLIPASQFDIPKQNMVSALERISRRDGFDTRYLLQLKTTDYFITNIEPSEVVPVIRPLFLLYQKYTRTDEGRVYCSVDNRDNYSLINWTLKKSSD